MKPKIRKRIALICIDCEGNSEQINRLVSITREEKIDVTFFVVGQTAQEYSDLFYELAKDFQIESHTYSHVNLRKLSIEKQVEEILRGKEAVERVIGRTTRGFKAPMHCLNKETVKILNELGLRFDVSSLYFQYRMGKVIKIRPSWFREWCSFYDFLNLNPRSPWAVMKFLFFIKNPLVISIHPQYSGKNEEMSEAFRGFVKFLKRRKAQIININDYLGIIKQ